MEQYYKPRELKGRRLFGFIIGPFGKTLANILIGTYAYNYYVYTINLSPILAALGSSIFLIVFAITSILFGPIIDNKKPTKYGKRKLFLLFGVFIWLVSNIVIWVPPIKPSQAENPVLHWETALYFWGIMILRAISGAMMETATGSMFPEQSQTITNREKVATYQSILMIIASVVSLSLPLILQSILPDPKNMQYWTDSGKFTQTFMFTSGAIMTSIGFIFVLITYFTTDESFHQPDEPFEKKTISKAFTQILIPIRDQEYRKILGMGIFGSFAGRIQGMVLFPFLTYVLATDQDYKIIYLSYIFISFFSKFIWLGIWKIIMRKQKNMLKTYRSSKIFKSIAPFIMIAFFWEFPIVFRIIVFIISFGTILGTDYSTGMFSSPVVNKIVDNAGSTLASLDQISLKKQQSRGDNEIVHKKNIISTISGSYVGLMSFTSSISSAIASFILGFIFSSSPTDPLVITIVFCSIGFFFVINSFIVRRLRVKL